VTGLAQAAAESTLVSSGLVVGTVNTANSDTVPAGNVISQAPLGGTLLPPGSAVDLVVSLGPAPVPVPDVTGLAQATAESTLVSAGFTVGTVTNVSSDTVPVGDVVSQAPLGGSLAVPGSAVDLVVSSGPAPVAVPDVTGLVGAVDSANHPTVPVGAVISQVPVGGTLVPPGSAVALTVSLGPAPVAVPDVTGLAQATAESTLVSAGFTVGTVTNVSSDTVPAGNVVSQAPLGGSLAVPGSAVDLVVSSGPAPVAVPDVTGLDRT
jgi:beta-lactam-binding protein with PASTA domain